MHITSGWLSATLLRPRCMERAVVVLVRVRVRVRLPTSDGLCCAHRVHIVFTSRTHHAHIAFTSRSHRGHIALAHIMFTSRSHRGHIAITSRLLTSCSHRVHIMLTSRSHRDHIMLTSRSHRVHIAHIMFSEHSCIALKSHTSGWSEEGWRRVVWQALQIVHIEDTSRSGEVALVWISHHPRSAHIGHA